MKKVAPPFDKTEWNFKPCTDSELEVCWRYEVEREKWRANPPKPENVSLCKQISTIGDAYEKVIFGLADFPTKPWLAVDKVRRKEAIRLIRRELISIDGFVVSTSPQEEDSFRWDRLSKDDNVTAVVLHLDWRKSDTKLKKEFETVLSDLRAARDQSRNTGRKGAIRDRLNALGARRLLRHFGNNAERAIEHMDLSGVPKLYSDARALRRAARKADVLISGNGSTET